MSELTGATNGHSQQPPEIQRLRRRSTLMMLGLAALIILVAFLTWHGTWFGRSLSDEKLTEYFNNPDKPRNIQHALTALEQRIEEGDGEAKRWYPQIVAQADNTWPEIRSMAAWVMGQDNTSAEFHRGLERLLNDPHPLVRRNAALGLVRFNDSQGHDQIMAMLQPYSVKAATAGVLTSPIPGGEDVPVGALLASIKQDNGSIEEVRSPLPGEIKSLSVRDGARVAEGDEILIIAPHHKMVWEALRALVVIGRAEDLTQIERYANGAPGMPRQTAEQAAKTIQAIKSRQSN